MCLPVKRQRRLKAFGPFIRAYIVSRPFRFSVGLWTHGKYSHFAGNQQISISLFR